MNLGRSHSDPDRIGKRGRAASPNPRGGPACVPPSRVRDGADVAFSGPGWTAWRQSPVA